MTKKQLICHLNFPTHFCKLKFFCSWFHLKLHPMNFCCGWFYQGIFSVARELCREAMVVGIPSLWIVHLFVFLRQTPRPSHIAPFLLKMPLGWPFVTKFDYEKFKGTLGVFFEKIVGLVQMNLFFKLCWNLKFFLRVSLVVFLCFQGLYVHLQDRWCLEGLKSWGPWKLRYPGHPLLATNDHGGFLHLAPKLHQLLICRIFFVLRRSRRFSRKNPQKTLCPAKLAQRLGVAGSCAHDETMSCCRWSWISPKTSDTESTSSSAISADQISTPADQISSHSATRASSVLA